MCTRSECTHGHVQYLAAVHSSMFMYLSNLGTVHVQLPELNLFKKNLLKNWVAAVVAVLAANAADHHERGTKW